MRKFLGNDIQKILDPTANIESIIPRRELLTKKKLILRLNLLILPCQVKFSTQILPVRRECHISRKVVENYISILEDLLLAYRLPVFIKRAQRAHVLHPKFYLFDAGVYYHLLPKGPMDNLAEMNGIALEGLVLQHLKA